VVRGVEEQSIRQVLEGLEARSLTWQPPSMEDAFFASMDTADSED
jgi:hypothetical protein